jgi:hypothetical protein
MTKEDFVATIKNSLDLNLSGNKTPFVLGLNSNYYTPIYDVTSLMTGSNVSSFGLVITKGWNNWQNRKEAMKEVVEYAVSKNCVFTSGIELIKRMRELQAKDAPGKETAFTDAEWKFVAKGGSTTTVLSSIGAINNASVTIALNEKYAVYECSREAGFFTGLDHVELTYSSTAPLRLIITMKPGSDKNWQVMLNNTALDVKSGKIPLSAFNYFPNDTGTKKSIETKDIAGFALQIAIPDLKASQTVSLTMKDFKFYAVNTGLIDGVVDNTHYRIPLRLLGAGGNALKLNNTGIRQKYTIALYSSTGRLITVYDNITIHEGVNTIALNDCSSGLYLITVSDNNRRQVMKTVMVQ